MPSSTALSPKYTISVSLTNAVDSVSEKFFDKALGDANASDKSRAIFRAIYKDMRGKVRIRVGAGDRTHTEPFPIDRGILQGDMFSPLCFVIALAYAFKKVDPGGGLAVAQISRAA